MNRYSHTDLHNTLNHGELTQNTPPTSADKVENPYYISKSFFTLLHQALASCGRAFPCLLLAPASSTASSTLAASS